MATIGKDILYAAKLLNDGKLVAIPTETVYGLAANALDAHAIAQIFEVKNRPFFDPLILHTYSLDEVKKFAKDIPNPLLKLAHEFWPGPLTILVEKKDIVPDLVTSGLNRVAIRIPNHLQTLQLLKELNFPLAAPSANPFGYVSPTQTSHVQKQLGEKISYILDGGNCEVGIESTIIGMEEEKLVVYRLGGLSLEAIESLVGKVERKLNYSSDPFAPGQLKSHYAPLKKLIIGNVSQYVNDFLNPAVIYFGEKKHADVKNEFNLSSTSNLIEAATNLFHAIREMDESDSNIILCEKLPEIGLGRAINDRLLRASVKN